jgi:putative transposase
VTQRGNRRLPTFFREEDYREYLRIAAEAFAAAGVEVWAYCLMPNHVHIIATPSTSDGLAAAVGNTHHRYTRRVNLREGWTGFLWQGRFASFPMDEGHLRKCVRYVGLNPVRAGLVNHAADWPWSSVRAHLTGKADNWLTPRPVAERLSDDLQTFFDTDLPASEYQRLRNASLSGRPLGTTDWVEALKR